MKKLVLLLVITVSAFAQTVTDIDGNVYKTVNIFDQVWMAENLRTTRYNNGDLIPNVKDSVQWGQTRTGAYCYYNNDQSNASTYGVLYNMNSVNDSRGLAPKGWHIATVGDWEKLIDRLGGWEIAGGKLKESGTIHWRSPNTGATNEVGFNALPGGARLGLASFNESLPMGIPTGIPSMGFWWSFTIPFTGSGVALLYNNVVVGAVKTNLGALSIRCVKDAPAVGVKDGKNAPLQFSLSQNYPNPFNPSTLINYQLPINSFVTIIIYNSLGQKIETFVNKQQPAGNYSINWSPKNLNSGVYFYKIQTEKYTEMKKMIFLK